MQQTTKKHTATNLNNHLSCKCCGYRNLHMIGTKEGYRFWECPVCRFVFTDGVQYEEMKEKYSSGYHDVSDGAPKKGWMKIHFLDPALAFFNGQPLKIMDFGCGQSLIPSKLRKKGHHVTGVDIVPPIRPHPDRLTGDILTLDIPENSFDLIYSFQVFEHLPNPVPVIQRLLELLKPGGYLFIHTDMEVPERENGFFNWWYVLPPDHCSYYRLKTFREIFKSTPHKICHTSPKAVTIRKV